MNALLLSAPPVPPASDGTGQLVLVVLVALLLAAAHALLLTRRWAPVPELSEGGPDEHGSELVAVRRSPTPSVPAVAESAGTAGPSAGEVPGQRPRLTWDQAYGRARAYAAAHGHCRVPQAHVDETGFALGRWVQNQRAAHRARGIVPPPVRPLADDRVVLLEGLPGWAWAAPARVPVPAQRSSRDRAVRA